MQKKIKSFIIVFTFILTSFLLGVVLSDKVKETYVNKILKTNYNSDKDVSRSNILLDQKDLNLDNFWKVYSIIKKDYYDLNGIKKQYLLDGALKGLVNSLGDKNSEFMSKKENIEFSKMLSGDFEGIGAFVEKLDFGINIERILKGSPAEKYGIKNNDIIIEANGEKLEELTLYDAVSKIKGPSGTKVLLKILRLGEEKPLEIEVTRGEIKIPSVEYKYIEKENIGYIAINMFGEDTSNEFNSSLVKLKNKNIDGLIIDLRNNGGGFLDVAVDILSNFIERGDLIVTTKYKNRLFNETYYSKNSGEIFDKKIVVLINNSSASASEITAGVLMEYNKAILVGEKSYGKGSIQKPFQIGDGSMVKLTIAKWFTPKDKNIDGKGINPDIKVEIKKEDYSYEECVKIGKCDKSLKKEEFKIYDRQLEEAKKVLKSFLEKETLQIVIDEENKRLGNKIEN